MSFLDIDNINRSDDELEFHPLKPFISNTTKILFLGSFPPQRKRWCIDFFYPNFINDHWRIQGLTFYNDKNHFVNLEKKSFKLDLIVEHCKKHGFGYFDTATAIRRTAGNASDKFLEVVQPTDIYSLIANADMLKAIVTTGTKATETLCNSLQMNEVPKVGEALTSNITINGTKLLIGRLPSSSRAYPLSLEKKAEAYREMFNLIGLI